VVWWQHFPGEQACLLRLIATVQRWANQCVLIEVITGPVENASDHHPACADLRRASVALGCLDARLCRRDEGVVLQCANHQIPRCQLVGRNQQGESQVAPIAALLADKALEVVHELAGPLENSIGAFVFDLLHFATRSISLWASPGFTAPGAKSYIGAYL